MTIDYIIDARGRYETLRTAVDEARLEILFTHIVLEELAATPDKDRRGHLLVTLVDLGRMVPTGAAVVGFSRLDQCRASGDDDCGTFEAFRSGSVRHTRDALTAATARFEKCSLVTFDERLAKRAREHGIAVLTPEELIEECGSKAA